MNGTGLWVQQGQDIDGEAADDWSLFCFMNAAGDRVALELEQMMEMEMGQGIRIYEWDRASWIQQGQDIDGEAVDNSGGSVSINASGDLVHWGTQNDGNGMGQDMSEFMSGTVHHGCS